MSEQTNITRATQRGRILELLIAARGDWVPLPKVQACAAQYNARLYELRRLGFRITNRTREMSGQRHSWFRLESIPAGVRNPHEIMDLTVADPGSFPEFGSLAPESYGVD